MNVEMPEARLRLLRIWQCAIYNESYRKVADGLLTAIWNHSLIAAVSRSGSAPGLEYSQICPWAVAFKCESGTLPCVAKQLLYRLGAAGIGGKMNNVLI